MAVAYAVTMTAVVGQLAEAIPGDAGSGVLRWALLLGTVLGGSLTAVGASANIRHGAVVTVLSFVLFVGYLWLRYFARS